MMITGCESILALMVDTLHFMLDSVLNGNDTPTRIGIEHIGNDDALI